jgi:hypothetical protein
MEEDCVKPDPVTFVGVLKACAGVLAFEEGNCAHQHIIHSGCEFDVCIGSSSLVDMFAKWKMLGGSSTRWPYGTWSLGLP